MYIIKLINDFIMRIKRVLLKKKKLKNNEIDIEFIYITYYIIIKKGETT